MLFFHISDLKCEEHVVYYIKFIKKQAKHLSCFVCKLSCHGAIISTKFLQYIKAIAFMTKNNNRKKKSSTTVKGVAAWKKQFPETQ